MVCAEKKVKAVRHASWALAKRVPETVFCTSVVIFQESLAGFPDRSSSHNRSRSSAAALFRAPLVLQLVAPLNSMSDFLDPDWQYRTLPEINIIVHVVCALITYSLWLKVCFFSDIEDIIPHFINNH